MNVDGVVVTDGQRKLADRFEKRQAFDVADGPPHFHDHHVVLAGGGQRSHAAFDLIRNVRNHLDGRPQVIPPPFLGNHFIVHLSCRRVVLAGHADVEETLVVPQVEVRFGTIVGDIDFAVLERVHRSRIDVDVRVELLNRHTQAARL